MQMTHSYRCSRSVLEAVNRPELKHLTNCIVFAAPGARSEPDRMGGGDLAGDTFFAVFDPLLILQNRDPLKPVAPSIRAWTSSKKWKSVREARSWVACEFMEAAPHLASSANPKRRALGAPVDNVEWVDGNETSSSSV
ncbi:hypothetical protein R3P38DRAFT_3170742 [Favolaschia claudopus]|uniref:RNA-dependent RNA polymerase n=1 Tax=Favolaschia claudopus TaxID=2862362 RepID=A0AAW0DZ17_9AGAR